MKFVVSKKFLKMQIPGYCIEPFNFCMKVFFYILNFAQKIVFRMQTTNLYQGA